MLPSSHLQERGHGFLPDGRQIPNDPKLLCRCNQLPYGTCSKQERMALRDSVLRVDEVIRSGQGKDCSCDRSNEWANVTALAIDTRAIRSGRQAISASSACQPMSSQCASSSFSTTDEELQGQRTEGQCP